AIANTLLVAIIVLALIAPGFGGVIPVRPALLADYFGTKYFGTINGWNMLVVTLGSFFGPWTVGLLVDSTGSYGPGWVLCGVIAALSVPMMLFATPPRALMTRYGPGSGNDELAQVPAAPVAQH